MNSQGIVTLISPQIDWQKSLTFECIFFSDIFWFLQSGQNESENFTRNPEVSQEDPVGFHPNRRSRSAVLLGHLQWGWLVLIQALPVDYLESVEKRCWVVFHRGLQWTWVEQLTPVRSSSGDCDERTPVVSWFSYPPPVSPGPTSRNHLFRAHLWSEVTWQNTCWVTGCVGLSSRVINLQLDYA